MTGEQLPVGEAADPPAPVPDLRVSHADRDQVVELLVTIDQRFGSVERTGRWVVPRRMAIRLTAGNVKLDFSEAVITAGSLRIDVDLGFGGDLLLVTKPGIVVITDELNVRMGDIKVRHRTDPHQPVILRVELAGRIRGGDIKARDARRTFGQWIRREHPG